MATVPYLLAFIALLLVLALRVMWRIEKRLGAISGLLGFAGEAVPNLECKLFAEIDGLKAELSEISRNTEPDRLAAALGRLPTADLDRIERALSEISHNTRRDTSSPDEWRGRFLPLD